MGNLGKYQDIVTEAKLVGGVDKLITIIEEAAAAKVSSKAFGKGAGVGVLSTLIVGGVAVAVRRSLDGKKDREALANEAKEQLKAEPMDPDGPNLENGEGESDSDGGKRL